MLVPMQNYVSFNIITIERKIVINEIIEAYMPHIALTDGHPKSVRHEKC